VEKNIVRGKVVSFYGGLFSGVFSRLKKTELLSRKLQAKKNLIEKGSSCFTSLEILNITSRTPVFNLRISLDICSIWWPLQNNTGQKSDKYNFPSKNNPCFLTTLNYVNTCLVKKECHCRQSCVLCSPI
jgi:hypothetical protein